MAADVHPLIWVGFLSFFVVSLVVGVRLVLLAGHTRRLPELMIGVGVLGIGPVGFGAMVAAQEVGGDVGPAPLLAAIGMLAASLGVCCKFVFNWRVYHPESSWVQTLVFLGIAGNLLTFAQQGFGPGYSAYAELGWNYLLRITLQIGALLWGSAEALRYWGLMRKRVRIGLADPVVANRFLLWGIGAGAAGVGSLIGTVAHVVVGAPHTQIPWVLASSSLHGLVAAVAMWLAFVPPRAYTRWVAARAPQSV